MTRFRSRAEALAVAACLLGACAAPSGEPAAGFVSRDVESAYIPLQGTGYLVLDEDAAAVSLGGGIAVTDAHNENLLDGKSVIGTSRDYDLAFFRTGGGSSGLAVSPPHEGERVIAYGQYRGELRKAEGNVLKLDAAVKPECDGCAVQSAFTFESNAGPGFSGGPVLDAATGSLVGIVFGYVDNPNGPRTMYAYTMERVYEELKKIESRGRAVSH